MGRPKPKAPTPRETNADKSLDLQPFVEARNPLLVVVSGPSGAGKDSVIRRMQELGHPFYFVITATTRPPRPGETDGVDYYFVSPEEFAALQGRNELIENALVYGVWYGIPKTGVRHALASGQDVVMRVDVQGAATVKRLLPDAILIFLLPGSAEELLDRLHRRHTESAEALSRRIVTIREEMERIPEFDYVVVNRDGQLDQAVDDIAAIIRAEKRRTRQRAICL